MGEGEDDLRAELARLRAENADLRRRIAELDPAHPIEPASVSAAAGAAADPGDAVEAPSVPDRAAESPSGEAPSAPVAHDAPRPDEVHETDVDLPGLMVVLSRHLYSTPMVAVRELVQNAHDSVVRRRRADPSFRGGAISLHLDGNRLVVTDDGDGMTLVQLHDALGVVGRGVTGASRAEWDDPELIGQFGVGFLSAFVLGESVTVHTMSATEPGLCTRYRSGDAVTYAAANCDQADGSGDHRAVPGTTVTVELAGDGLQLADDGVLHGVLQRYCALLRVPIRIDGVLVNEPPPWRVHVDDPTTARRLELAFAARFEHGVEPLCVLPVRPTDRSDVRGMLWVQDALSYATSDRRNLSVFVRGMLLDDDARDLLPTWAGMVGGVIESVELVPTASREEIQRTATYEAARAALAEQLVAGLGHVAAREPQAWRRVVRRHSEALLGAAVVDDEVFNLVADIVEVPTSDGDLRPVDLVARSGGRIHVAANVGGGAEELLCRCLRVPVAHGLRFAVLPFLRRWCRLHAVPLTEIGTGESDLELFGPVELEPTLVAWLQHGLAGANESVAPCTFEPAGLPVLAVVDRDAELKARIEDDEADRRIASAALRLARAHTANLAGGPTVRLHVNLANPHVQRILAGRRAGDPGADEALRMLRSLKEVLASGETREKDRPLLDAIAQLGDMAASYLGTDHQEG